MKLANSLNETLGQSQVKKLKIEVFGLGYVGFPLAIRLALAGWKVIGIDINPHRLSRLKQNELRESEEHLKKEFLEVRKNNHLLLFNNSQENSPKIGIICVPTPIQTNGNNSQKFVKEAIEKFLETSKEGDVIIIESSIEVGTTDEIQKLIEKKNFEVGKNFGLAFCPERIDPQNKKWTLENIPRVIYASDDTTFKITQNVYHNVNNSNLIRVSSAKVAEVVKSFENTFRLVNISLVNELAMLCDRLGINISEVIKAASTKPFGFMPFQSGAGAGGHCIPKDPTFLLKSSKKYGLEFYTIENAIKINKLMPEYVVSSIEKILTEKNLQKSVIVCGLSYKPDIEDMRDSPGFKILYNLIKKRFQVAVYDPHFRDELKKKYFIENNIPEIEFTVLQNLDDNTITNFSCLCIVQHHTKNKFKIEHIYRNSILPLIYDCQNKLMKIPDSNTTLESLGG